MVLNTQQQTIEKVQEYLQERGPTPVRQLAKDLNLDLVEAMEALRDLMRQSKTRFLLSNLSDYLKRYQEVAEPINRLGEAWKEIRSMTEREIRLVEGE